jgi:hypothetical protein
MACSCCTGAPVATQLSLWRDKEPQLRQRFREIHECKGLQKHQQAQGHLPACSDAQRQSKEITCEELIGKLCLYIVILACARCSAMCCAV